jgi:hypothetical protein
MKLMFFAPCEKVIESIGNSTSLISVLEHFAVKLDTDAKIPEDAALPFAWSVMILWNRNSDVTEPTTFESKIELFSPSGDFRIGVTHPFVITNDYFNFRNQVNFPIFPIGQEGIYKLILSYKKQNSKDLEIAGEYPIRVYYVRENVKNENQNGDEATFEQSVERVPGISSTGEKVGVSSKKRRPKKVNEDNKKKS